MSYAKPQYFATTIASGATVSGEVNFGKSFSKVMVVLPSATTYNVFIQAAPTKNGSFSRIYNVVSDNDAVVTPIEITSATAGANGAIVPIPFYGDNMKIEVGTAVAADTTFGFIGVD